LDIKHTENSQEALGRLVETIEEAIENIFAGMASAKFKVQRWFPGVIEEIVEEVSGKTAASDTHRLMKEASFIALDRNQKIQTTVTQEKSVQNILGGDVEAGDQPPEVPATEHQKAEVRFSKLDFLLGLLHYQRGRGTAKPRRCICHKTRSTPVVGGGLFGEAIDA
jgi:HPt (histidine-containing phosphotransfer) domain-containing protein